MIDNSDLPKKFNTWVEFLDSINYQDLRPNHLIIIDGFSGSISEIKNNALDELLSERFEKKAAMILLSRLHLMLYDQMTPQNKIGECLSKIKRIILTQSKTEKSC